MEKKCFKRKVNPIHHFNTFPDIRLSLQERNENASFNNFSTSQHIMPHVASLLMYKDLITILTSKLLLRENLKFPEDDKSLTSYS